MGQKHGAVRCDVWADFEGRGYPTKLGGSFRIGPKGEIQTRCRTWTFNLPMHKKFTHPEKTRQTQIDETVKEAGLEVH